MPFDNCTTVTNGIAIWIEGHHHAILGCRVDNSANHLVRTGCWDTTVVSHNFFDRSSMVTSGRVTLKVYSPDISDNFIEYFGPGWKTQKLVVSSNYIGVVQIPRGRLPFSRREQPQKQIVRRGRTSS